MMRQTLLERTRVIEKELVKARSTLANILTPDYALEFTTNLVNELHSVLQSAEALQADLNTDYVREHKLDVIMHEAELTALVQTLGK